MGRVSAAEHPGSKEDVFVLFGRSKATHEIVVKTQSLILDDQFKKSMLAFLKRLNAMWLLSYLKYNCRLL